MAKHDNEWALCCGRTYNREHGSCGWATCITCKVPLKYEATIPGTDLSETKMSTNPNSESTLAEAPAAASDELIVHSFTAGTCLDPEIVKVPVAKGCLCELRLARHPDGAWRIGYVIGIGKEESINVLPEESAEGYSDRHAALGAALAAALAYFAGSPKSKIHKKCAGEVTAFAKAVANGSPENAPKARRPKLELPEPRAIDVRVDRLEENPHNPRGPISIDEVEDLAETIKQVGLLQPIGVRIVVGAGGLPGLDGDNQLQLLWGHRRAAAFRRLKRETIAARVYEGITDDQARLLLLIENGQQKPLDPIQEAKGYAEMVRDFGLTQNEVADQVRKSRPVITNAIRLLGLPEGTQSLLAARKLTSAQGLALCRYAAFPRVCNWIANFAVKEQITAGELEDHIVGENGLRNEGLIFKAPNNYEPSDALMATGAFVEADSEIGYFCLDAEIWQAELARLKDEKKKEKDADRQRQQKDADRQSKGNNTAAKAKKALTPADGDVVSEIEFYLLDLVPEEKVAKGVNYGGAKCTLVLDKELWAQIQKARKTVLLEDEKEKSLPLLAAGWKHAESLKKIDGRVVAELMFAPSDSLTVGSFSGPLAKRLKLTLAKAEKKVLVADIHYHAGCKVIINELAKLDAIQLAKLGIGLRCEMLAAAIKKGQITNNLHWLRLVSGMDAPDFLNEDKAKDQEGILRRIAAEIAPEGAVKWAIDDGRAFKFNTSGVCTNAQVIKLPLKKPLHCEIRVARHKNAWAFGYDYGIAGSGTGCGGASGGPASSDAKFASRGEAIVAVMEAAKDYFANNRRKEAISGKFALIDFLVDFKHALKAAPEAAP